GLGHLERNGHHYFGRAAALDPTTDSDLLTHHPDLVAEGPDGVVRLRVQDGVISTRSVLGAPFGLGFLPRCELAEPLSYLAACAAAGVEPVPSMTTEKA